MFGIKSSDVYISEGIMQTAEERVGQAILASISRKSGRPRYPGGRSPMRTLAHLLQCYRLAVDAETRRLVRRADFFWREAFRQLEAAWRDDRLWNDVLQQQPVQDIAREKRLNGESLRNAVARELFADSLWALHHALQSIDDTGKQRSMVLLDLLRQLVDRTGPLDDARMAALGAAVRDAVHRSAEGNRWQTAETLAAWLLDRVGGEQHENLLAAMIRGHVLTELTDAQDERASRSEAASLAEAIRRIEHLHDRFPRNAMLFNVLGELHLRAAIKLANGGRLSEGLVAGEKATTYDPGLQTGREVRDKLVELMQRLRHEADTLREKVASTPNAALTSQGQEIIREAELGFASLNAFIESPAAREIAARFRVAQGSSVWQSIGLPLERPSDAQLNELYDVLNSTFRHAQGDPARAAAAWQQAIREVPAAAALDSARILPWVRRRIAGAAEEPAAAAPVEWPVAVASGPIAPASRHLDREPFTYWLFSSEAIWPKAACAAALVALCIAVALFARDSRNRHEREAALEGLRTARAAGEYARLLDAAETFLSHPLSAPDPREAEVKAAYSEALVRWFTEETPGPDADRRAARYRTLMPERTAGGSR